MSIPGLIADMDMMLSINESVCPLNLLLLGTVANEACQTINAQLLNLYDCPNPLDSDDYLISHNIKMGYELAYFCIYLYSLLNLRCLQARRNIRPRHWGTRWDGTKSRRIDRLNRFSDG